MQSGRAIAASNHAPGALASYRDSRCQASVEPSTEAFTSHDRAEHVFALRQALGWYACYQAKVAACAQAIEAVRAAWEQAHPEMALPAARYRTRQAIESAAELRAGADGRPEPAQSGVYSASP